MEGLRRVPEYSRIDSAVTALGQEPRPTGARKLSGQPGYRIRISDYRVVYDIEDAVRIVSILKVGHRSGVYHK